jgi:DNA-binding NtrC family response regulator
MEALVSYHWPGNIRELENVIERSVLFCEDGARVEIADLPKDVFVKREAPTPTPSLAPMVVVEEVPASSPGAIASSTPVDLEAHGEDEIDDEPVASGEVGLKELVREATAKVERDLILGALSQTMGNVTHAAKLLKISRKSLQTKMKELGLREPKEDVG